MGAPLSSLAADVFMDQFERNLFQSSSSPNVLKWFRYVDDILCIWNGSLPELEIFHYHLNSLEPSIKFTLEIGGNSTNFLDLTITLRTLTPANLFHRPTSNIQNGPQPSLEISSILALPLSSPFFVNLSNSGVLMHGDSFHPYNHKFAAFNSIIHRLLSLPLSPVAFQAECSVISRLPANNNLQVDIRKIIRRKLLRKAMDSIPFVYS